MIAVAASVEKNLLLPFFLRVENIVAAQGKKTQILGKISGEKNNSTKRNTTLHKSSPNTRA